MAVYWVFTESQMFQLAATEASRGSLVIPPEIGRFQWNSQLLSTPEKLQIRHVNNKRGFGHSDQTLNSAQVKELNLSYNPDSLVKNGSYVTPELC